MFSYLYNTYQQASKWEYFTICLHKSNLNADASPLKAIVLTTII